MGEQTGGCPQGVGALKGLSAGLGRDHLSSGLWGEGKGLNQSLVNKH